MTKPSLAIAVPSHDFQFTVRELATLPVSTLLGLVAIVALTHVLNLAGWLPAPARVEEAERVIVRHRFEMLRRPSAAKVVIVGDSTSAINIQAPSLGRQLPGRPEVLNQGMFMGLDLGIYGDAAGDFIRHHPDQVKLVVLLVAAQRLRNADLSPAHQQLWHDLLAGKRGPEGGPAWHRWLAVDVARHRVFGRILPGFMYGQSGYFYGFTYHLRRHLKTHGGSMIEHGMYNPPPVTFVPDYELTAAIRGEARTLRSKLPTGVRLAVGISPLPESHAPANYHERRNELLREFGNSLRADHLLTNLPVRLPNGFFTGPFHLNPQGAEYFTRLLAAELTKLSWWNTNQTGIDHPVE